MRLVTILLLVLSSKLFGQSVVSNEFLMYRDEVVVVYHPVQFSIELTNEYVIIENYKLKITSKPVTFTGDDGYMISLSCKDYEVFVYYTLDKYVYKVQIMYNDKLLEFKITSYVI